VLALVGIVVLAEMGYRLQAVRNGAAPGHVFGLIADPGSPWPWLLGAALFLAGAVLLRRTAPLARAAWQAEAAA